MIKLIDCKDENYDKLLKVLKKSDWLIRRLSRKWGHCSRLPMIVFKKLIPGPNFKIQQDSLATGIAFWAFNNSWIVSCRARHGCGRNGV